MRKVRIMSTQLRPSSRTKPSLPEERAPLMRRLQPSDRPALLQLVGQDGLFSKEEVSVALELIDAALAEPGGEYRVLIAELDGKLAGYICYGPTPMTEGTWDLYWIATH